MVLQPCRARVPAGPPVIRVRETKVLDHASAGAVNPGQLRHTARRCADASRAAAAVQLRPLPEEAGNTSLVILPLATVGHDLILGPVDLEHRQRPAPMAG